VFYTHGLNQMISGQPTIKEGTIDTSVNHTLG
jgi:hypothetical protein